MTQNDATRAVTISYTLANAPAVVTLDIQTNAVVGGATVWASIGGANIQNFDPESAVFKKVAADGDYTIVWHPDRSWPDNLVADGGARAVVTAWAMDDTPDYMVVPLIAKYGGETEYYPDETYLPQGILGNVRYRTSMLVMRRIHARNVPWTMGTVMEPGRTPSKEVPHTAMLTNDYYIGVFPITQTQWSLVGSVIPASNAFTNEGARAMRPVNNISRGNCRYNTAGDWPKPPGSSSFLGKLRSRTELDFDLPTEGEWEFACRAGGAICDGQWNDGSGILVTTDAEDANLNRLGRNKYNGGLNYSNVLVDETGATAIVGSYEPNAWGLYDMHGNVWEWCLDWYSTDRSAYGGLICTNCSLENSTEFSLRGGCGATPSLFNNRVSGRSSSPSNSANQWYGVRVVCRAGLR
jgi:formylglycine-generating enzyme required for sulfatase activity